MNEIAINQSPVYNSALAEKVGSNSPSQNEMLHAKPSNLFEDITEDDFNRRERAKADYRKEL